MKDSVTVKIMADGVISVSSVVIRIDMNSDDEFKDLFISWNDEVNEVHLNNVSASNKA